MLKQYWQLINNVTPMTSICQSQESAEVNDLNCLLWHAFTVWLVFISEEVSNWSNKLTGFQKLIQR